MLEVVGNLLNIVGIMCVIILLITITLWGVITSILFLTDTPRYEVMNKFSEWRLDRRLRRAEARARAARQDAANDRLLKGAVRPATQERLTRAEAELEDAEADRREWEPRTKNRLGY